MNLLTKIRELKNKFENKKLTKEFNNAIEFKKRQNMEMTLYVLTNYLVYDQLERTGILYRPEDNYIQTKVQRLFFEWKDEGIINEYETFNDYTWNWIKVYAEI